MPELVGRRVAAVADIELPGDYCGPLVGYSGPAPGVSAEEYAADPSLGLPACFFLLPNAPMPRGTHGGHGSIHHVTFPPHTFRECDDGSLEIRASIGAAPWWHGYLDEGHRWRDA